MLLSVARRHQYGIDRAKQLGPLVFQVAQEKDEAHAPPFGRGMKAVAARHARAEGAVGGDFPLKDVKRVVLPNGLTLLLYEDHRLP